MAKNYYEFPDLAAVYLEDSYVLRINEGHGTISFSMLLVLTEQHPRYHDPLRGEQYCYANADLVFNDAREVQWLERNGLVYTDATGEADLGNIDTMAYNHDHYELSGDWGQVQNFTQNPPRLTFT
jgi:hypothetical protein